jgi:hypothetical protein
VGALERVRLMELGSVCKVRVDLDEVRQPLIYGLGDWVDDNKLLVLVNRYSDAEQNIPYK